VLIHGAMEHERGLGGGWFAHAWVLDPRDDTVFDSADQCRHRNADYPGIERVRYTHGQMVERVLEDRYWGCYDVAAEGAQLFALQEVHWRRTRSIPLPSEPGRYAVRNGTIVRVEDGQS
jgi:hypothetical protein